MNTDAARSLLVHMMREVAPEVDLADIGDDVSMQEALDLDSMDFLRLVALLHDQTGIDVPERDYSRIGSIGEFVAYVENATR